MIDGEIVFRDLLKVYAGIEHLRHLEGDKHLIVKLDSRDADARLAGRATDAQVAVDIIHTGGTVGTGYIGGPIRGANSIMSSHNVAELSGGQFTSVRTAADALARIDEASRHTYLLGYVPANPTMDGKYRNVTVKVNRPGVTVLYPHGYTAQPDLPPLNLRETMTRLRLEDAAATDAALDDIKVQVSASRVAAEGAARQLRVELKIDAAKLSLKQVGAKREGKIDLLILCGDEKQNVVCSLNQQMTVSLDEARYQQALNGGIPYVTTVPVTGVATQVKVVVYDFEADLLGSANVRLR